MNLKSKKYQILLFCALTDAILASIILLDFVMQDTSNGNYWGFSVLGNIFAAQILGLFITTGISWFMKSNFKTWRNASLIMFGFVCAATAYYNVTSFRGNMTESNGRSDIVYGCELGLSYDSTQNHFQLCGLRNIPKNLGDVFRNIGIKDENGSPAVQEIMAFIACQAVFMNVLYFSLKTQKE